MARFSRNLHAKSVPSVLCIALLSMCPLIFARDHSPGQAPIPAKSDAQISFVALKSLAGTWTGPVTTDPANSELEGPIQVTMRVASGGSVLMHEIAPGGMPEPTIIYLDENRLTLIHYCEAGNRPRMVARRSPDQKTVRFDFISISGGTSPAYLHNVEFTIVDADRHIEDWWFMLPGDKKLLHAHFDLKRAKDSIPPPAAK